MNFEEHAAKPLLAGKGIAVPRGGLAKTPDEAAQVAARIGGTVVVKAQVPTGKRGKAGGVKLAATPDEARAYARSMIGMEIAGHKVEKVLVEEQVPIARELYAAVLNDPSSKGPLAMFSTEGGMDIEETAATAPGSLRRRPVDIRRGFSRADAAILVKGLALGAAEGKVIDALVKLYEAYAAFDAELLEINPLIVARDGRVVALDCKFVMDDSAIARQPVVSRAGTPEKLTGLEARAKAAGLKYIDLDGNVGVLANGAGLTMTTMDVVRHHGGRPANFLEIGGEVLHAGQAGARVAAVEAGHQEPRHQLLRRLRAHRCHEPGCHRGNRSAEARAADLLFGARHRRRGSDQVAEGASGRHTASDYERRLQRGGGGSED